ncbi:hypothetical protein DTO212C5_13 [Paecilomyces variotii]|nr:hypothetical protein DTO212C5_13 [Paecilomyces variotii]
MDSGGTPVPPLDDALPQIRDLPQLSSLRIAPLRQPVSSRTLSVPSPLEPSASGIREPNISKANSSGNPPAKLPTLEEFLNAARTNTLVDTSFDSISSLEPPPKTILPAFINLRTVERLPYPPAFDEDGSRKRPRLDVQGEMFVDHLQLPIPHAQNEKKPPPFGPFAILNGLNEPPPNAALFPPIEPGSISQILTKPTNHGLQSDTANTHPQIDSQKHQEGRREGRLEEILDSRVSIDEGVRYRNTNPTSEKRAEDGENRNQENKETSTENSEKPADDSDEPMSPKTRGRSRKKLRKWTEQETNNLLRGVVKCGIGNWTTILAQPELKFNKRSAANLKDRFRVCCPWAYGAADPNEATKQLQTTLANALLKAESQGKDGTAGKILLPDPRPSKAGADSTTSAGGPSVNITTSPSGPSTPEVDAAGFKFRTKYPPTFKATPTLSNKSKSTLVSLGIPEPYFTIKSKRRSRRPFTPAEDEALLKGYAVHGFQWTLIQQDKHLNLSHRKATDLRDRFRTKFPNAYREGGSVSGKTFNTQARAAPSTNLGEPGKDFQPMPRQPPVPNSANSNLTDRNRKTSAIDNGNMLGPIDPALLPPAPPLGLPEAQTNVPHPNAFPFPLDENTSGASNSETPWEDNTLPPLVWDELP